MKINYAIAAAALLIGGSAQAATIVDTGPAPANFSGYAIGGNTGASAGVAGRFTLSQATIISAIQFYGADNGPVQGLIRADGATPGASLYSGTVASTDLSVNQWVGLSGLNWLLAAGSYWVSFEAQNASSAFREARNFPNPLAQQAFQSANVYTPDTTDAFAFRVFGDAVVPTPAAAVPELASWAMIIAGFGAVGSAIRRRRERVAVRFA